MADLKKQVMTVWEDVKRTVGGQGKKARAQLDKELVRLREERDRLFVRLGEQTLTWINNSPVPVPAVMKGTVGKLNQVVESMKKAESKPAVEVKHYKAPVYSEPAAKKKASAKKKAAPAKKKAAAPAKKAVNKAPVGKKAID